MSGAAALSLILAGCSSDNGGGGGSGPQELTVWIMEPGNPEVQKTLDGFAEKFEELHEGVTVNIEYIPWAEAHRQLTTAITGGQVPDVSEMGNTMTAEFAEVGAFAPVEVPADAGYVEGLVSSSVVDGTAYGYPWYAGARALIYRTDIFEEAGVEVPQTWDELLEVGDTIAEKVDGIDPIHVAGSYQHMFQPLIWGAGGDIATQTADGWQPGFDTPEGHAALEFFLELWERGWTPEGAVNWNSVNVREAFANGQSAMMIGGGWDLRVILDSNPDLEGKVGTALMPAGPSGSRDVFAGGSHLVVFEESKAKELAHEFVQFLIAPEQATAFADQIGFLPGTVAGVEATVGDDPLFGVFGEQFISHSRAYPVAGWWDQREREERTVDGEDDTHVISDELQRQAADEEEARSPQDNRPPSGIAPT